MFRSVQPLGLHTTIYFDYQHQNPLDTIVIAGDSDNNFDLNYDREKYKRNVA